MPIMDLRLKSVEGTEEDTENAQGNLGTSYHLEPFVKTLKAKMKSSYSKWKNS